MKGISFTTELIPSVLSGEKTVTRRLMNPQPILQSGQWFWDYSKKKQPISWTAEKPHCPTGTLELAIDYAPYKVGGIYYIKETWNQLLNGKVYYKAPYGGETHWKSGRFMPESASRGKVRVKSVRAEQVQEITHQGILDEGWDPGSSEPFTNRTAGEDARDWYSDLWDKINGKGSWESNPWVWPIEFELVKGK